MSSLRAINKMCVCVCVCVYVTQSCPTVLRPHRLWPARLLCPWNSPGENTRVGCHFLLQGIYPSQGLKPSLLHYRQMLYCLSCQGSPSSGINKTIPL